MMYFALLLGAFVIMFIAYVYSPMGLVRRNSCKYRVFFKSKDSKDSFILVDNEGFKDPLKAHEKAAKIADSTKSEHYIFVVLPTYCFDKEKENRSRKLFKERNGIIN